MDQPATPTAPASNADELTTAGVDAEQASLLRQVRTALVMVATLALVAALYLAKPLILPLLMAVMTSLLLAPAVRMMGRWHLPRSLSAALLVCLLLTAFIGALSALVNPVETWVASAPSSINKIERSLKSLRKPLNAASQMGAGLDRLAEATAINEKKVLDVRIAPEGMLLTKIPMIGTQVLILTFLTFLLLAHGEHLLRKLVTIMPGWREKRGLVETTREIQRELSRYLATITLINAGLGGATALTLALIGVEQAWIWGIAVMILNFAPYAGPAIAAALLAVAGFQQFDQLTMALSAPIAYLTLHGIESQVFTPLLVGRRLGVDPLILFVGLLLFGWIWGISGLLLAVPTLACARIMLSRLAPTHAMARLLAY